MTASYVGAWIVLVVVVFYGPMLIGALANPSTTVQVAANSAGTLLLVAILSLAPSDESYLQNRQLQGMTSAGP